MIAYLAAYINSQLRTQVTDMLPARKGQRPRIWAWDDFRIKWQFGSYRKAPYIILLGAARHAFTVLPCAVFVILYLTTRDWAQPISLLDAIEVVAIVMLASVILISIYTARLYYRIADPKNWQ